MNSSRDSLSHTWGPGANLPSTTQLKEGFDASNATIRKALRLLKDEQFVVSRAGAAVTVREHRQRTMRPAAYMAPTEPGQPYRWLAEAAKLGAPAHSTLLGVVEIRPPADVVSALSLDDAEAAVLRHQVLSIARDTALTAKRKIKGGTPTLLGRLWFPPRLSVDRVSARAPTQEQHQALNLPSDLPALRPCASSTAMTNAPWKPPSWSRRATCTSFSTSSRLAER